MRLVLLDDARHRMRDKRGGGKAALPVEGIVAEARTPGSVEDLLALDQALTRLEAAAPELAQIVEWRFFAGLSDEEIAATLEVSDRTVRRQWRAAKAFLYRSLSGAEAGRSRDRKGHVRRRRRDRRGRGRDQRGRRLPS